MAGNFLSKSNSLTNDPPRVDALLYTSTNGSDLQHVCVIRHDINFVINKLNHHMQLPTLCHYKVVTRVL